MVKKFRLILIVLKLLPLFPARVANPHQPGYFFINLNEDRSSEVVIVT